MAEKYSFETLALADKAELENVLLSGDTPNINQLDGYSYCGWNHEPVGKLTGRKFKKSFVKKISDVYGFNQKIKQDSCDHNGQWNEILVNGLPSPMGFFKVSYVKDELVAVFTKIINTWRCSTITYPLIAVLIAISR